MSAHGLPDYRADLDPGARVDRTLPDLPSDVRNDLETETNAALERLAEAEDLCASRRETKRSLEARRVVEAAAAARDTAAAQQLPGSKRPSQERGDGDATGARKRVAAYGGGGGDGSGPVPSRGDRPDRPSDGSDSSGRSDFMVGAAPEIDDDDDDATGAASTVGASTVAGDGTVAGGFPGAGAKAGGARPPPTDLELWGPPNAVDDAARRLQASRQRARDHPRSRELATVRTRLPAWTKKEELLLAIRSNQVVVVQGATGCGKTTQLPQFIVDDAADRGEGGRLGVVVTQPRRLSAISVSTRVAQEMGEPLGGLVGYAVRLEQRRSADTKLLFCTTGVLLRRLVSDRSLRGVSHVVVDEIHERGCHEDFLLTVLRDVLPLRPDLRVVLMSATLDAGMFAEYFSAGAGARALSASLMPRSLSGADLFAPPVMGASGGMNASAAPFTGPTAPSLGAADKGKGGGGKPAPVVVVPGFTHPVDILYLEETLMATGATIMPGQGVGKDKSRFTGGGGGGGGFGGGFGVGFGGGSFSSLDNRRSAYVGSFGALGKPGKPIKQRADAPPRYEGPTPEEERRVGPRVADSLRNYANNLAQMGERPRNDLLLVEQVISHIARNESAEGAVLVFLTGWDDIQTLQGALERRPETRQPRALVIGLHGSLSTQEQQMVFDPPPPGVRKIVLATNIAETSVTIDDVVFVIDGGKAKEKSYDPLNGLATLQGAWISKASCRQRSGRAGRVRPGRCYRLYPRRHHDDVLEDFQKPEMHRTPLTELCLQIKSLRLGPCEGFLRRALEPPSPHAVHAARTRLAEMGALTLCQSADGSGVPDEVLTPLGEHLARLPVDPAVGKAVVLGVVLGCLDPVLTIAAGLAHRDPWQQPPQDKKKQADDAKRDFAAGLKSDHLALQRAFDQWRACHPRDRSEFCFRGFLRGQTLQQMEGVRDQLAELLADAGFLGPPSQGGGGRWRRADPELRRRVGLASRRASNAALVVACVCAGSYPNVAAMESKKASKGGANGQYRTMQDGRVELHQSSVLLGERFSFPRHGWAVYTDKTRTGGGIYLQGATVVPDWALVLFGGSVEAGDPFAAGQGPHGVGTTGAGGGWAVPGESRKARLARERRERAAAAGGGAASLSLLGGVARLRPAGGAADVGLALRARAALDAALRVKCEDPSIDVDALAGGLFEAAGRALAAEMGAELVARAAQPTGHPGGGAGYYSGGPPAGLGGLGTRGAYGPMAGDGGGWGGGGGGSASGAGRSWHNAAPPSAPPPGAFLPPGGVYGGGSGSGYGGGGGYGGGQAGPGPAAPLPDPAGGGVFVPPHRRDATEGRGGAGGAPAAAAPAPTAARTAPKAGVRVDPALSNGLPPGWQALYDPSTGASYYHHGSSGTVQYERPG